MGISLDGQSAEERGTAERGNALRTLVGANGVHASRTTGIRICIYPGGCRVGFFFNC